MKHLFWIFILALLLLSCSRDWNSPLENDPDLLHQPQIVSITPETSVGFKLVINYSYSASANMLFERRTDAAFEPITLKKLSTSVFADTTLDMELDHSATYRLRVQKGTYYTEYSNEKSYDYISTILNVPSAFTAITIELQGVRLNWQDNSNKETGYKIERNFDGAGFAEIAALPANTETYLNSITGMPTNPMSLVYRVKAYTTNLNSAWLEQNVIYSGLGAPSNLTIADSSFNHFTITWTRNSTLATGYEIERKKDNGVYISLAIVGAAEQTYIDQINTIGTYSYRVRAVKDGAFSTYSNEVSNMIHIVIPTVGLIAYYPFNGNANDESGFVHNGTANGAVLTTDRFGEANQAYDFDGINDYIEVPSTGSLSTAFNAITLSAWVNVRDWYMSNDNSGWASMFRKGSSIDTPYGFQMVGIASTINPSYYGLAFYANSGSYYELSTFITNHWYHVAVTYDGSYVRFYVDGEMTRSYPSSISLNSNSEPLQIGEDLAGDDEYMNGKLDNLGIYNRALSDAEIQALYHEGGWSKK
jgi:hypothetical protein